MYPDMSGLKLFSGLDQKPTFTSLRCSGSLQWAVFGGKAGAASGPGPWRPSKPGMMVNKRNHPKMAQRFRLVNYYILPRCWNVVVFF